MSRYFSRPKARWGDDEPLLPSLAVSDHEPVRTGLLDHRRDAIWRGPNPVGFHNPRDR